MASDFPQSRVSETHPDFAVLSKIRDALFAKAGGKERLSSHLPLLIKEAVDFVLDPVRTARTAIGELDKVEKTFIGLKIEHYLRDWLGVPRGLKRDLNVDGIEVDIKNTVSGSWMIPPESIRTEEPCILVAISEPNERCWLGVVIARECYLTDGKGNRDAKRRLSAEGVKNIMWLVDPVDYPPSHWVGIDMANFRELRRMKGGNKRAAEFFRRNLGRVVYRSVIQSLLHDQDDYMRRLRGDKKTVGTRDILKNEGILLACGVWGESKDLVAALGFPDLKQDEWVAVRLG